MIWGVITSGWNCILKAKGSAVWVTIHNTSFNLYCEGKGSYRLIKISYVVLVLSSNILLAITKLLPPKFR